MWLFQKLGPRTHPGPTENTETPKNGLRRAKIGVNAPHVVQLTGFGPKKTNLNRSVPRCVPFTRNQPAGNIVNDGKEVVGSRRRFQHTSSKTSDQPWALNSSLDLPDVAHFGD